MGIQDRDYIRSESRLSWMPASSPWAKFLFFFLICFYLAQLISWSSGRGHDSLTTFCRLDSSAIFERLQVWRLVTAIFVHDPSMPWSMMLNLYFLWVFGQLFEEMEGAKKFFLYYFGVGFFANFVIALSGQFWPVLAPGPAFAGENLPPWFSRASGWATFYYGSSGSLVGLGLWLALKHPDRMHPFAFLFVLPIKTQAVVYAGLDWMTYLDPTHGGFWLAAIGHAAAAGVAFVAFAYVHEWRLPWRGWMKRGTRHQPARTVPQSQPRSGKPHLDPEAPSSALTPPASWESQLDAVLAKLAQVGRDQLTEAEKGILEKASENYRRRRG